MQKRNQLKLTDQETDQFLETIKLHKYVKGECRLKYLEQAMEKTQEFIPFQNIFLIAKPLQERRQLSFQEIKESIISGQGGYCLMLNTVFCCFLQSLGYETKLIHASCRRIPENHSSIIVENILDQGDRYLVDVCLGYKNMPLKIDFEQRSQIQSYSFAQYYYEWENDTKQILNRIDLHSSFFCSFSFEVFTDYEDMLSFQGDVYTNVNKSPYHNVLRIIRFPPSGAICFRDNELLIENINTRKLEVKDVIKNLSQFLQYIEIYFPMLDQNMCISSYNNFFSQKEIQNGDQSQTTNNISQTTSLVSSQKN